MCKGITIVVQIFLIELMVITVTRNQCSYDSVHAPKYHLIEKCHRSKLGITAKANFMSLTRCQRLGVEKKGLALNFSPPEAGKGIKDKKHGIDYTCEVLKCAEADGGLSLVQDTAYDYYSMYGKPLPNVNSTCVPAMGMFYLLTRKFNHTEAQQACKNVTSVLADISGEQRTDALAQLLAGASVEAAFIGLSRKNGSGFVSVTGTTLDCLTYRAWAPGHPRKYSDKYDCVLITRYRTWRSVSCKRRFPVLCELTPKGPYVRGSIFATRNRTLSKPYL